MPLLHRLANSFADKYGDKIDSLARDLTAGMPRTGAEGEMRRLHDEWARTAELHRPYWTEDSRYEWVGTDRNGGNVRLACTCEVTFVRRDRNGLYTARGDYSWTFFYAAGPKGLITTEPPKPPKGQDFYIAAELADAHHPERWDITFH